MLEELIPIFALSIPIVAIVASHRRKMAQMQMIAATSHANGAQLASATQMTDAARRVEALEARVAVLERIVTDPEHHHSKALADEIDALR